MRRFGGMSRHFATARMRGHALAAVKNLHGGSSVTSFDLLADELIGRGIVVAFHLHVVVQSDANLLPLREHIRVERQACQRGPIEFLVQLRASAGQLAEWFLIQLGHQFPDRFVQLPQAEELTLPQHGHHPTLGK
jgi:hypothetical protein